MRLGGRVGLAALRFAHEQAEQGQQQTGQHDHEKRPAPVAGQPQHQPAEHDAERTADRDGGVEVGQDRPAAAFRIQVGKDGGRGRPVRRLSGADDAPRQEHHDIPDRQTGRAAGQAPHGHAEGHQLPARQAIGEAAEQRRQQHEGDHERRGQEAHAKADAVEPEERLGQSVGEELMLDGLLERGQHVAVEVVKHINEDEEHEGRCRSGRQAGSEGRAVEGTGRLVERGGCDSVLGHGGGPARVRKENRDMVRVRRLCRKPGERPA